jgi:hypothetical protein
MQAAGIQRTFNRQHDAAAVASVFVSSQLHGSRMRDEVDAASQIVNEYFIVQCHMFG